MSSYFTDEDLTAFLDNECTQDLALRIAAAIKTDERLNDRLKLLAIDKESLKNAFLSIQPSPASIQELPVRSSILPPVGFSLAKVAAGIVVGIAIGAGAMLLPTTVSQPDWKGVVASYQSLYTADTLKFIDQNETDMLNELARVAATLEKKIDLKEIRSFSSLSYKRAQVLAFQGQPVIQLAFLNADGEPYALCITRANGVQKSEPNLSKLEGLEAASWTKDGYDYLFIGGQDRGLVSRAAKQFLDHI